VRKLSILLLLFYTTNVFSADTVNELKNKKPLYDGFTTDDIIIAEPIRKASKRLAIMRKPEEKTPIKIDIKNLQNFSEQQKKDNEFLKRLERKPDPDLLRGLGTLTDLIKR